MYSYLHSKLGGTSDNSNIFSGFKLDNTSKAMLSNLNLNTKKIQTKEIKLMNGVSIENKEVSSKVDENNYSHLLLDSDELFLQMKPNLDRYIKSIYFSNREIKNKNGNTLTLSNVNRFHFDFHVKESPTVLTIYPLGDSLEYNNCSVISEYPFEFKYKAKITMKDIIADLIFDKNSDFFPVDELDSLDKTEGDNNTPIDINGYMYGLLDKNNISITVHNFTVLSPDLSKYKDNIRKYLEKKNKDNKLNTFELQCNNKFECIKTLKELQIEGCIDVRKDKFKGSSNMHSGIIDNNLHNTF